MTIIVLDSTGGEGLNGILIEVLPDTLILTLSTVFLDSWGDERDICHLLDALEGAADEVPCGIRSDGNNPVNLVIVDDRREPVLGLVQSLALGLGDLGDSSVGFISKRPSLHPYGPLKHGKKGKAKKW
ncbi:MAG: hypothetical protein WC444_03710 [Candidatus Paceibacterota bacterium]